MPRPLRSALSTFIAALISTIGACILATFITAAQDSTAACDQAAYEAIATALDDYAAQLRDAAGNPDTALRELRDYSATQAAACSGFQFSSETEGQQPVIGPITIPEGLYRITATTTGYLAAELTLLEGECGTDDTFYAPTDLFNLFKGQADTGAQLLIQSKGCETLIEISNSSDPWTFNIEKLR